MLAVPWLLGWALRPYLQLSAATTASASTPSPPPHDSGSAAARAQVNRLSSPSAARPAPPASPRKPVSPLPSPSSTSPLPSPLPSPVTTKSSPYPVLTAAQPLASKPDAGRQVQPQPVQQVILSKATASKTSAAVTPLVAKRAQAVQGAAPPDRQTLVSSKTITLSGAATMSEDWAQQQLEKFKVSFDEADRDKSGFLSFDEVFNVLTKNGFKGGKDEAKKLFAQLDVDNDQKLSRDEFASAMKKLPRMTVKEFVLRKAFQQLDKDKSGTLTRQEIESAAKQEAGLDIAADKIADLLVMLSKDTKDNVVDYEEFLRAFGIDQTATVMHHIFKRLDTDKSGFLTKDEIMKAVEGEHELKLRAAKISDLLLAWHKDADKKISYDEFLKVWTTYR